MDKSDKYIRAGSLQEGEKYLYRTLLNCDNNRGLIIVTFIAYTACPAIVVVKNLKLGRFRCNRMDIFIV